MLEWLDLYLVQKAPFQIPADAKEWIVTYGPWITLVLIAIAIPPLLLALGFGLSYVTIVLLVTIGLRAIALPGLFARKLSGWTLLFYAQLASFAFSLLSGSIVGAALGLTLSLYVLFQVRPLYRP